MATINIRLILIALIMTLMGAFAAMLLKKASNTLVLKSFWTNIYFIMGGIIYLLSAFINIYLLKYLDYSVVLPITSLTYIWTMIIANKALKEKITNKKIFGTFFIVVGVAMISIG